MYNNPFLLDESKLYRIVSIIQTSALDDGDTAEIEYRIRLRDGREFTFTDLNEVLGLDNTTKNPIVGLLISSFRAKQNVEDSEFIWLEFGRSALRGTVYLSVKGVKEFSKRLFVEVEEQVERTFVGGWSKIFSPKDVLYWISALFLAMSVAFFILTALSSLQPTSSLSNSALEELSNAPLNTTEEKIDFLVQFSQHLIQQLEQGGDTTTLNELFSTQNVVLGGTIIIILGIALYTLSACYPVNGFLWGDFREYYEKLVKRRQFLWSVVVVAFVIGVISNLFVANILASGP